MATPTNRALSRWHAAEIDDDVLVVRDWITGEEVILGFNEAHKGWDCSACGPASAKRLSQAVVTCVHATAGLVRLPVATAVRLGASVASTRIRKKPADGVSRLDPEVVEKARAAIARAEAKAVRGKYADRDAEHERITSAVTTRVMTDEDRALVAERRAKKRIFEQ